MTESRQYRRALQRRSLATLRATDPTYMHAHALVAKTAKEFASVWYEEAAHNNSFYTHFPDGEVFVATEWPTFIAHAREQLGKMLASAGLPESMKEEIHEALILDRQLPRPDNTTTRILN